MKKILIVLTLFLLCACVQKEETNDNSEINTFIEPVKDEEIFDYLNADAYNLLFAANDNEKLSTTSLKNFGKKLLEYTLTDFYGKTINLSDFSNSKLVIELVTTYCSYCKYETKNFIDSLKESLGDITLIQYFMNGDKEGIDAFYKEVEKDIPDNVFVVPSVKEFSDLVQNTYDINATPTFLFFNNGSLTWYRVGPTSSYELDMFYDIAFNDGFNLNNLTDEDGNSIFSYLRTDEDVKNDLSAENYQKLVALDNDNYTVSMTLSNMGKTFDFTDQLDDESVFYSEVNFLDYINSDLMIVFVDELNDEEANMLNTFYQNNKDVEMIVLDISDENTKEKADSLDANVVSIMNQVPSFLSDVDFINFPSCLYVKEGTITGVYSNIESLEKLEESVAIFLKDTSIALSKNNSK